MDGYIIIGTELYTKSFDAQIEELEDKLRTLQKSADETNIPKQFRRSAEETKKLNADLYTKENKLNDTTKKIDFGGWTKSLSKVALSLFSVAGIFGIIRKASSTYLSNNEQTAQKMQSIWTALGNLVGPIIEAISNGILKFIGYLNVIVQTLSSGKIDLTKNINSSTNAMKKLNKQLAKFDEMNVLSSDNSNNGSNSNTVLPELNDNLVKKLQKIAKIIKGIWDTVGKIVDYVKYMFKDLASWVDTDFRNLMIRIFGPFGNIIVEPIKWAVNTATTLFNNLFSGVKKIIDGIIQMFRGNFKGGIKNVFDGLLDILTAPFEAFATLVKDIFTSVVNFINDAINLLIDVFDGLLDILTAPFEAFANLVKGIFTSVVNFIIDAINLLIDGLNKIKIPGTKIGVNIQKLNRIGEKTSGTGGDFRAMGGIYYPSKMPKLAMGGIINNPGAGVPYHGATIAEKGAEAVVPLTQSQQMELLGEAIGRYVSINLTNITQLDGRQIARKVDKISQNNNFVLNR